jgi:hypothetical protein
VARRPAASIRAPRTTAETGVPSWVSSANALRASSSGLNVIVSAMPQV